MKQYLEMMRHVRENGVYKSDRTGTGTYSVFGYQMRFDLSDGSFPLVTTKQCHLKSIIHELLWFLQGETNIRYLAENGVRIWNEWVKEETAEYRDMVTAEIQVELVKFFKATDFSAISVDNLETPADYVIHRNEDDSEIVLEYASDESWKNAYRDVIGGEPRVLIAGELGPVYGSQWRSWPTVKFTETELSKASGGVQGGSDVEFDTIDQISNLIEMIKKNPDSRRLIVSAWNPAEVDNMALPPCHTMFQFYSNFLSLNELVDVIYKAGKKSEYMQSVRTTELETDDAVYDHALLFCQEHDLPRRKLSCQLYQRSADIGLGVPFNIASYALLLMMIAQVTDHVPGDFIWTGGDCHIYSNHLEQIDLQLTRDPHPLPTMKINPQVRDILDFKYEDFILENYVSHPHIAMPVAV